MSLKTTQLLIGLTRKIALVLAVLAGVSLIMKLRTIAMIMLIALVVMLVVYFALALVSWRCPSCHQYLPLKNATKLKECPHCHHPIDKTPIKK
ncbi:hypothetical protein [Sharpea porci]|jgi:hypothetical protein|uniref:hypothetical protein n=1 Tax=Sharpea porci TaxID=2652286 RepID=UPI00240A8591|nr:hypothetical protein [Sharpea porci]MDD6710728.1 hypothetical protein [Sharpea porci]MDY5279331.1 hypothetical protein [Sharpea porci]